MTKFLGFGFEGADPLNMPGKEIKEKVDEALTSKTSKLVMVVLINDDDEVVISVLGPPSRETLGILKQATQTYEKILSKMPKNDN